MEIARLQPFPLMFEQGGFLADTDYVLSIMNDHTDDLVEIPVTSDSDGNLTTPLPDFFSRYDAEYRTEIYAVAGVDVDETPILGNLIWTDTLSIARPYVDVSTIAEPSDSLETLAFYESIARFVIDSITGGFGYKREFYETMGNGADFLPIPMRLNRIVKVAENGVLMYDAESTDPEWTNPKSYYITQDKTAISISSTSYTGINRRQSRSPWKSTSSSDSFTTFGTYDTPTASDALYDNKTFVDLVGNYSMFPLGWDYTLLLETGWAVIPDNIKKATMMLINDLKCNGNPYLNSYIKEYESDQYTIKIDALAFRGTGNRVVDKILEAYPRETPRLGVL